MKKGMAQRSAMATMMLDVLRVHFENGLQVEKRVELAGVPNDALACGRAEKRNQYALQIRPTSRRRLSAAASEVMPALLIWLKMGDSFIFRRM